MQGINWPYILIPQGCCHQDHPTAVAAHFEGNGHVRSNVNGTKRLR